MLKIRVDYKLFYNIFTNYCCGQLLISFHPNPPLTSLFFSFIFTNNHSPHQQFVKIFVKKFVSLALLPKKMSDVKDMGNDIVTNYFITFLQTIVVVNFLLVFI